MFTLIVIVNEIAERAEDASQTKMVMDDSCCPSVRQTLVQRKAVVVSTTKQPLLKKTPQFSVARLRAGVQNG